MRFRGDMTPTIERLLDVRKDLLALHKMLLDLERVAYEANNGPIRSIGVLLTLVSNDPWFAWLHTLSRFIVEIDEALMWDKPMTDVDATQFLERTHALLSASKTDAEFEQKYHAMMQREPDVVVAHGALLRKIAGE